MRLAWPLALSLLLTTTANSKDKVIRPPAAPLPDVVTHARVVMVTSEAGGDIAYDEAYKCMREWGRFALTGNPEKADLIFSLRAELSRRPPDLRDLLILYPPSPFDQQLYLVILDPKTNQLVWADKQTHRFAFKGKNQEKETILAVDALFKRLRDRIP